MACAQFREALDGGTVDEETIKTLFDSIESLTLDKRMAEKNLLEMKQLVKKINWIPDIQAEIFELNSMNSIVLELKSHIDELATTRDGITMLWHSHSRAKRNVLNTAVNFIVTILNNFYYTIIVTRNR